MARKTQHYAAGRWFWAAFAAGLILLSRRAGAAEERFALLQIGTRTYTNVTVTTKAKTYIFILHAAGMTSIKTAELSPELKQQLGYAVAGGGKGGTNTAAVWAKREIAKMNVPQIKALGLRLGRNWRANPPAGLSAIGLTGPKLVFAVAAIALLVYLFHCFCCLLICRKTGHPPGALVWVPVLQLVPLIRAAGMSGWWFLGYCIPVLNIVAQVLWSFNIAKARGKSVWVGVLLLLPIASLFAFLYLAFSTGATPEADEEPESKIMTLQTA